MLVCLFTFLTMMSEMNIGVFELLPEELIQKIVLLAPKLTTTCSYLHKFDNEQLVKQLIHPQWLEKTVFGICEIELHTRIMYLPTCRRNIMKNDKGPVISSLSVLFSHFYDPWSTSEEIRRILTSRGIRDVGKHLTVEQGYNSIVVTRHNLMSIQYYQVIKHLNDYVQFVYSDGTDGYCPRDFSGFFYSETKIPIEKRYVQIITCGEIYIEMIKGGDITISCGKRRKEIPKQSKLVSHVILDEHEFDDITAMIIIKDCIANKKSIHPNF